MIFPHFRGNPYSQVNQPLIFRGLAHYHMDVSENSGTPKSSISIGFSTVKHPFWGTPIFGKHPYWNQLLEFTRLDKDRLLVESLSRRKGSREQAGVVPFFFGGGGVWEAHMCGEYWWIELIETVCLVQIFRQIYEHVLFRLCLRTFFFASFT